MFCRYTNIGKKDMPKLERFNRGIGTFKDHLDLGAFS